MVLRTLCGLALFSFCLPLACSSGDEDSASADGGTGGNSGSSSKGGSGKGGSGKGGADSSGGESSGGGNSSGGEPSGSSGSGGEGTSGGGGGPALPECGEDAMPVSDCEVVGSVCATANGCCRCIDFPSAPTCGSLWDCARPELNMETCPENPPTPGTACMVNLSCQYCDDDGPHYFFCGIVEVGSDEGEWNEGDGLSCNQ